MGREGQQTAAELSLSGVLMEADRLKMEDTDLLSSLLGHLSLVIHVTFVSQNHSLHVWRRVLKTQTRRTLLWTPAYQYKISNMKTFQWLRCYLQGLKQEKILCLKFFLYFYCKLTSQLFPQYLLKYQQIEKNAWVSGLRGKKILDIFNLNELIWCT